MISAMTNHRSSCTTPYFESGPGMAWEDATDIWVVLSGMNRLYCGPDEDSANSIAEYYESVKGHKPRIEHHSGRSLAESRSKLAELIESLGR